MTEHRASRTLVKSPPELWVQCSDAASLARHLGQFGEIRITRLDPETAVCWEGEDVRGTVKLEPSGWGTRVILTAVDAGHDPPPPKPQFHSAPAAETAPPEPRGLLGRLKMRLGTRPVATAAAVESVVAEAPAPPPEAPRGTELVLTQALDSLGRLHHRPFSRG